MWQLMVDNLSHLCAHPCGVHQIDPKVLISRCTFSVRVHGGRFTDRRLPSIHSSFCLSPVLRIDNPIKRSTVKAKQDHSPERLMGSCMSYFSNTGVAKHPTNGSILAVPSAGFFWTEMADVLSRYLLEPLLDVGFTALFE